MNRFEITPLLDIRDNLTGEEYPVELGGRQDLCDLLNELNDRADKNAEKFDGFLHRYNLLIKYTTLKEMYQELTKIAVENLEENIKYREVMAKYHIDSVEKLDKILFYARKW